LMTEAPYEVDTREPAVVSGSHARGGTPLIPSYFLESRIGMSDPPPITHPEYFYGFLGVALAWQIMFFVIAYDPQRYRLAMLVAFLEKRGFSAATIVLFVGHRTKSPILALADRSASRRIVLVGYATIPKTP
jgi:hypothetical protein